jgi:hypothetical protein
MRRSKAPKLMLAIANRWLKKEKTNLYQKDVFFESKPNKEVSHI